MAYNDATNYAMLAGSMYGPNPYSAYPQGIPPTSYRGMPTDASGNPIQPPPGMTLNSSPAALAATPAALNNGAFSPQQAGRMLGSTGQWGISGQGGNGMGGVNNQAALDKFSALTAGYGAQPQAAAASQPGAQSALGAGDTSYRNALDLLSNPGDVKTPGANVPATQPITNQPSVLDQFLAGNKGSSNAAGGYSNTGFFDTLNRLKAMSK